MATIDPELRLIQMVVRHLDELDSQARVRIIGYLMARYGGKCTLVTEDDTPTEAKSLFAHGFEPRPETKREVNCLGSAVVEPLPADEC